MKMILLYSRILNYVIASYSLSSYARHSVKIFGVLSGKATGTSNDSAMSCRSLPAAAASEEEED